MLSISEVLVAFPALSQGGRGFLKHHVLIGLPPKAGRWTSDLSPFTGEKTSFPGVSQHTFSHGPLAEGAPNAGPIPSFMAAIMFSVASLIAQLVKNPPAIQETLVRFLDWKDPLEKG